MSNGVAMICNPVGGADRLIRSFENGIMLNEVSEAAIHGLLQQLVALPQQKILQMRTEAYRDAGKYYDRERYGEIVRKVLEDIRC